MRPRHLGSCIAIGVLVLAASPDAQAPPPATETALMAAGWTAFNQGNVARAVSLATTAVVQYPRSRPAVVLLVAAATARGGSNDGLAAYEQWLGGRRLDDAYTLRTIALALLREAARDRTASQGRSEAVKALTAEGDTDVLVAVATSADKGGLFETQLMARLGSEPAVKRLIAQLRGQGDKLTPISALVASRSPLAVPPLVDLLKDVNPDVRAAAADGLGRLGPAGAADSLRPLLDDQVFSVRFAAASALLRLHDTTGMDFLRQLEGSEHSMVRVSALEALSVEPDQGWVSSVLSLLRDPDPQVRLAAARLAAPYDLESVRSVVEGLMADGNIAIRDAATRLYVEAVASDFGVLRRLLHAPDIVTRVRAADRILALTR